MQEPVDEPPRKSMPSHQTKYGWQGRDSQETLLHGQTYGFPYTLHEGNLFLYILSALLLCLEPEYGMGVVFAR